MTWEPSKEAVLRVAIAIRDLEAGCAGDISNCGPSCWCMAAARAGMIAGHEDAAVPDGWKLVPIEPTEEMSECDELTFDDFEAVRNAVREAIQDGENIQVERYLHGDGARTRARDKCVSAIWHIFDPLLAAAEQRGREAEREDAERYRAIKRMRWGDLQQLKEQPNHCDFDQRLDAMIRSCTETEKD